MSGWIINHHQTSAPLSEIDNLFKDLCACTDDIKAWMTENQLKFNDDRTEAPITLGCHNIPFSDYVRNLGFILDSELSLKKHVIKICQSTYFKLKRISSICRFLTEDVTKTPVTSYIFSRFDYCNCLLLGTPNSVIQPLQKVQNFAATHSWHLVITTLHLSWKSCTGFPFQSALNTKVHACASVL